jgi:hypothetical protein
MGVICKLLLVLLSLVSIGIDIAIFFLLIRLIVMWRNISWLGKFNDIGKALVDSVAAKTGGFWFRVTERQLSDRGKLLISLITLSLAQIMVSEAARFL